MQEANEQTVLAHFNRDTFSKDGVASEFFRQDGPVRWCAQTARTES